MTSAAARQESALWDDLVARVLGPIVTPADRERRRTDALALAAAALRAAEAEDKRKINV